MNSFKITITRIASCIASQKHLKFSKDIQPRMVNTTKRDASARLLKTTKATGSCKKAILTKIGEGSALFLAKTAQRWFAAVEK